MPNKLADQSSPYLLQHKDNPVDWYPWSDEAFRAAKARNVPVLVSIGYSTCHWCHVMAHESFEDAAVAQLLNDSFVCIKVDREERPDIDAIYLQSMQALGYHTGWPLNVWLTPDGLPFYGGTYFPPTSRQGMPSFTQAILTIRDLWQRDRAKVVKGGQEVAKHVIQAADAAGYPETINHDTMQNCLRALFHEFDKQHGGFGKAPKFPHQTSLEFLLRHYRRTNDVAALSMVELTLGAMAEGGIHDQLGGGFSRYSVDEEWHVPHFEKMLYDNALLLPLYVDTYRLTGESFFLQAAAGIVRWLRTDMLLHNGAFAAASDADSEGVEGKFYIWTAAEIDALLSAEDADLIKLHFGVADPGSFEGANVLRIVKTDEDLAEDLNLPIAQVRERLQRAKEIMLDARKNRLAPHRDDKIIAGWNGLAFHALAYSGAALNRPAWIKMARNAAQFVTANMINVDGTMSRSWANGMSTANGVLEDYANVARGLLTLYGVTGEAKWADIAWNLVEVTRERFAMPAASVSMTHQHPPISSPGHVSSLIRRAIRKCCHGRSAGDLQCDASGRHSEGAGDGDRGSDGRCTATLPAPHRYAFLRRGAPDSTNPGVSTGGPQHHGTTGRRQRVSGPVGSTWLRTYREGIRLGDDGG
ncbi:MAG: thioredoxin domain-containing protein [Thermomicrobiales bacterium]|nr:thioredoxin domain-containing protein [Thermomicrobiales bacterium]